MVKTQLKNSQLKIRKDKVILTGIIDGTLEKQGKKSNRIELNFSIQDHVMVQYI